MRRPIIMCVLYVSAIVLAGLLGWANYPAQTITDSRHKPATVRPLFGALPVGDDGLPALRERIYTVYVEVDGKVIASAGADSVRDLHELIRTLAHRHAMPVRLFDENANQLPLPLVRFAIWDSRQEVWVHPGGVKMPETWDGWLTAEVKTHLGSWHD